MENSKIFITKMSGDKAVFDADKLKYSLERSGASKGVIEEIIGKVESVLYPGITTKEIYKMAFRLLRQSSRPTAARYKLKKAIMELGPTGFPFEKYIGEILRHQGFDALVGVIVKGHCVEHEVDVMAEKGDTQLIVECKYHSNQTRHCDVKIPLYIHSRFLDVSKELRKKDPESRIYEGWIFTNTRFTSDAIQYGNCAGLKMVGWDYPKKGSLKERVDIAGLYPVTCLTTLTKREKEKLLSKEKVLCSELSDHPDLLRSIEVSEKRQKNIMKEVHELCTI